MSNQKNAADRVRPFLRAMEQSIDAARQRRLNRPSPVATPTPPQASTELVGGTADAQTENVPPARPRARPKRPSTFVASYDEPDYRSQAS